MTNGPASPTSADLSVVDAWRLLVKPARARPAPRYGAILAIIALLNLSAIAALVAAAVPDPTTAALAALLHTAVIPGLLLAFAVVPSADVDTVEWGALAFGFGIMLLILGGLVLALLPGRVGPILVVGWTAVVSLGLSATAFGRSQSWRAPRPGSRPALLGAGLVVALAALLRLPALGYSEFQGDETEVVLRAAGVVQGLPDAIFYHGKGPGEVVAVAVQYGFLGTLSEGAARLPFALAGIGGVLAFYVLARRLLGTPGATAAGLLLAVNGYFLAFSRITQYQSFVLLLGTLALWCAVRWSQAGGGVWPVLAGALAATAALAHYDALFVLPPIALAALWRLGWRGLFDHSALGPWFRGAQVGVVILALFFVPYFESPLFALVTGRIGDRVGAGLPYHNLPSIVASGTLYLGPVLPVLVAALIALGVAAWPFGRASAPPARAWLLGLLWAVVPFLFYAFAARKPGTHVHVATSGLLLLAGAGFGSLWNVGARSTLGVGARGREGATRRPILRLALGGALVGLLAAGLGLVAAYLVPVYLQTSAELVRENRVGSLPLTWRPPGGLPTKERFGFPYQAGWKTIGALYASGELAGSYDANEQPQVTHWYTRGAWRCSAEPRYYLIAESVQDEIETPRRTISTAYHQIGAVTVGGVPKLRVYERGPADGTRPTTWAAEAWASWFDRHISAPTLDPGPWARGVMAPAATPVAVRFGDDVELLGYQVFAEDPRPGGVVRLDLFWLPRVSSDERHRIDVHLGREPRVGDGGGPACDKTGDDRVWVAGRPFAQRVSIPIAASAAPGSHPLLVSVSRLDGSGPLAPSGGPATADPLVEIGQIEVHGGSAARR